MMDLVDQLQHIDWGLSAAIFAVTVFLYWLGHTA